MKKNFRLALSSLALLAFGMTSCGDFNPSGTNYSQNNKRVESVSLSSNYESCSIGDSFNLESIIKFRNDEVVDVTMRWASSKISVAKLTVSEDYKSALVEVVGSGTTQISFIAGYKLAICEVYVPSVEPTPDPDPDPDPGETKITLSPASRTMSVGEVFNLTATVYPLADAAFSSSNTSIITIGETTSSACVVKAVASGEADVVVMAGDATVKCHVNVLNSEEEGDKDYTVYFYIDYNNADSKTEDEFLLAKFDWYYDRPLIEAKKPDGTSYIPTVTNDMAMDPAFPYFIGWSTHPIIDTKNNLWDLNKDTIADLPISSYSVILYGQWFDVPVLPA